MTEDYYGYQQRSAKKEFVDMCHGISGFYQAIWSITAFAKRKNKDYYEIIAR